MDKTDKEQMLDSLFKELQDKMQSFHDSFKKDDVFEKKRKLLSDIRQIQIDIIKIKQDGEPAGK